MTTKTDKRYREMTRTRVVALGKAGVPGGLRQVLLGLALVAVAPLVLEGIDPGIGAHGVDAKDLDHGVDALDPAGLVVAWAVDRVGLRGLGIAPLLRLRAL